MFKIWKKIVAFFSKKKDMVRTEDLESYIGYLESMSRHFKEYEVHPQLLSHPNREKIQTEYVSIQHLIAVTKLNLERIKEISGLTGK